MLCMFECLSQDFNVIDESGNAGDARNWLNFRINVVLLNKYNVYCVIPQSSKPPNTCKWGGPKWQGILRLLLMFLNRLTVICKTKRNKTKWNKTKGKSVIFLEWLKLSFCCENVCVYSLSCVITWQCGIHYITKKGHKRASIRIITKCFPIINMPEPCNNLIKANIIMSCILSGHSPNWIFKEELWNLAIESQI